MKIVLAFLLVFALNFSYSQESFEGKAFKLTTHFDEENCQDLSQCDCCTSDLIFINAKLFYYIPACEGSNYYYKGQYKVTTETLTLNFDPIEVVKAYNWEAEVDEDAQKFILTSEQREIGTSTFTIDRCNNKTLIRTITDETPEFGMEDPNWSVSELTNLEQSEPMKLLINN